MADTQNLITEIDTLVQIAERLARDAESSERGLRSERVEELSSIAVRGGQMIRKLYGSGSQYERNWQQVLTHKSVIWRTQRLYCPYSKRVSLALLSS